LQASNGNKGDGNGDGDGNDVGDGHSDEAGRRQKAGEGCKGNDKDNVRVMSNKEDEGSKAMVMAMATRMAGTWSATTTKRLMAMTTRVAGKRWQW
jgi:hypothetical protein